MKSEEVLLRATVATLITFVILHHFTHKDITTLRQKNASNIGALIVLHEAILDLDALQADNIYELQGAMVDTVDVIPGRYYMTCAGVPGGRTVDVYEDGNTYEDGEKVERTKSCNLNGLLKLGR